MVFAELSAQTCKKKIFLTAFIIVAAFQIILSSSILFGFSSLLVVFKDLKLYEDTCKEPSFTSSNFTDTKFSNEEATWVSCSAREKALNLPFAVGMILHFLVKIPLGGFIDNIGAKSSQYIGW